MSTRKGKATIFSSTSPPWGVPKVEMMVVGRGVNIHQWYVIAGLCAVHTLEVCSSDGLSMLVLMCQIVIVSM